MSHDLSPLGFRKIPSTRELTVRECFPFAPQAQVAAALSEAVQERMSAALIAPAGTGKTVALLMLVAALPEVRFSVHYVKVTGLSKRDLCKEIAVACGLSPTGIYPALVRKLQGAFDHTASNGMRPVILLDEAHGLRTESLAMLRVLTNYSMDSEHRLCLLLVGLTDCAAGCPWPFTNRLISALSSAITSPACSVTNSTPTSLTASGSPAANCRYSSRPPPRLLDNVCEYPGLTDTSVLAAEGL